MNPEWTRDIIKWNNRPLVERLEMLRKYYCTGPCGQSSSVLQAKEALSKAIKESIEKLNVQNSP